MTDPYENIVVTRSEQGWATITLNRPDRLNTLSIAVRKELAAAVGQLQADDAVHVLILTGSGKAFTAGLDLDEWSTPEGPAAAAYAHDAVAAIRQFTGPVIAAVNGAAVTGGVELVLACDVIIASEQARFADTHVRVGLLPGWGGSARLIQRVGIHRAKELALTARFFTATEAERWGFANLVAPHDQLMDAAQSMALQMLKARPEDLARYKQLLDDEAGVNFAEALVLERERSVITNAPIALEDIKRRLHALTGEKAR